MKRLLSWTVILFCACLWCSCSPTPVEEPREVVIGVITNNVRNESTMHGARLAAEELAAVGIFQLDSGPARFKVVYEDDEDRPETAVSKALLLINRRGAVALVGLPLSDTAIPVARVAEQSRVPLLSTQSTHPDLTRDKQYTFRMLFLNALQAQEMARFAVQDLGLRRVATLSSIASNYSSDLATAFGERVSQLGGEVVASETFIDDESRDEVDAQLVRIQASGAEALFMPYAPQQVRNHMLRARELGIETVFLGGDTWSSLPLTAGQSVGEAYSIDVWSPDLPDPKSADFVTRYRQAFGIEPGTAAPLAYDALMMLAKVIRRQGKADPDSIRAGLASLDGFEGVTGRVAFEGSGDPKRSAVIRKVDAEGNLRLHRRVSLEGRE